MTLPAASVELAGIGEPVPLREQILILHYIARARGTPDTGNPIAYSELPEGKVYSPTFAKRVIKPVVDRFGREPESLLAAASLLGGQAAGFGDVSVTIPAFPRVAVHFVLWRGDIEFPPSGAVLLSSNISDYLSAEDITVLCEVLAWRLVRAAPEGGGPDNGRRTKEA